MGDREGGEACLKRGGGKGYLVKRRRSPRAACRFTSTNSQERSLWVSLLGGARGAGPDASSLLTVPFSEK